MFCILFLFCSFCRWVIYHLFHPGFPTHHHPHHDQGWARGFLTSWLAAGSCFSAAAATLLQPPKGYQTSKRPDLNHRHHHHHHHNHDKDYIILAPKGPWLFWEMVKSKQEWTVSNPLLCFGNWTVCDSRGNWGVTEENPPEIQSNSRVWSFIINGLGEERFSIKSHRVDLAVTITTTTIMIPSSSPSLPPPRGEERWRCSIKSHSVERLRPISPFALTLIMYTVLCIIIKPNDFASTYEVSWKQEYL